MSVSKSITEFYNEASDVICNSVCAKCGKKCAHRMMALVNANNDTAVISDMFCDMLEHVAKEIKGNISHGEQSYSEYYKGASAVDFSKEISAVERSVKGSTKSCNMSKGCRKSIMDNIRKGIKERIGRQRIAELIYYKENHRFYDKNTEQAYTEIVAKATSGSNSLLSRTTYNKLNKLTEEIIASAANEIYRSVYGKTTIKDKYKPSHEKFNQGLGSKTPYIVHCSSQDTIGAKREWYQTSEYWKVAIENIEDTVYLTWAECYEKYIDDNKPNVSAGAEWKISKNTYLQYVTTYLPKLAGLSEVYKEYFSRSVFDGKYVASDLRDNFNGAVFSCVMLLGNKRKNRNYKVSRFELVQSIEDLLNLCSALESYTMVIAARLSQESYMEITKTDESTAKEIGVLGKIFNMILCHLDQE